LRRSSWLVTGCESIVSRIAVWRSRLFAMPAIYDCRGIVTAHPLRPPRPPIKYSFSTHNYL
jgi:hypothetical protein